ncbi:acetyl-CoA carboxylase biotin carboxyl carrier protein [Ornithobacterium rhinotracheale]|uniref:Biotin carboxyl carrier protein of acetyl-CoA carboxylase n=1 Tax=Ornithobacterium rhinotracheale (strain ATCC 51463 / DSM 15997 / CCUG 23171 / CIP 104009 / LMG 9086) TaxID=867902 RepID=I4A0Q9_ORNRL|nr:acetyl-CoA carboxylase biotin carboxyl carrier protein [Ornithobacterium rhinotracheale]AFL97543.1 acetyl-CoA carboxylase, biotin carboxyl carrier protein [Ornithobacterium rhinotracheale DSM 15997]AIP98931.1 acetyl-CoA carboxylase [Ornithobacterium rhinotracheale ORT-UMN 88]KGB67225.1 acetyl-CoA carboxylase [Ornithobacterium rhinotracheale H06-030791]MBN3661901.1 acetyl-CoA carboxylase biotin carboxyl carrier protein [Ornithobacterium rhinotracheale]MCK0195091.1 acetyl-CoA carboxylase biot
MDKKEIRELITFVSESGVSEVKLKTDKFEIEIKNPQQAPVQYQVASPAPAPVATPAPAPQAAAPQVAAPAPASEEADNYLTIKSPMIGTFYRKPSPDKDVFVNVGDTVKAGDVVCVIEAMKLFNEIESEIQGKIVKVLAEDSTPVEYDQPLFLVDPNA